MKRRTLLECATALAAPRVINAARAAARRIGLLWPGSDPGVPSPSAKDLWAEVGWTLGENLVIERRYAGWRAERMPELLDDMLRRQGVELLIAEGPDASAAAARATQTVPIVFRWAYLPIECGLIESYARPGRNCTGVTHYAGLEVVTKKLEFLRSASPSARRLAILAPDLSDFTLTGAPIDFWSEITAATNATGFEYTRHMARRIEDVDSAMAEAAATKAQVAIISGSPFNGVASRVVEFALRQRWATATPEPTLFDAGLLLLHATSDDMWKRTADMTARILRGAKPAGIPVELATRPSMSVNLKTARALGLALPQSLLLRADKVIE